MRELLSTGLIVASAVVLGLLVFTLGKSRSARGGEGGQTTAPGTRRTTRVLAGLAVVLIALALASLFLFRFAVSVEAVANVSLGKADKIALSVTNKGMLPGDYRADVTLDGASLGSVDLHIPGGQTVSTYLPLNVAPGKHTLGFGGTEVSLHVPEPARPHVTDLTVAPPVAKVGQAITLSGKVTNQGEVSCVFPKGLTANGRQLEGIEGVPLGPGEERDFSTTFRRSSPGKYYLTIADVQKAVVVVKPIRLPTGTYLRQRVSGGLGKIDVKNGYSRDLLIYLTRYKQGSSSSFIAWHPLVPVLCVYIRARQSFEIREIRDGKYYLYYALGKDWNTYTRNFLNVDTRRRFKKPFTFTTSSSEWYTPGWKHTSVEYRVYRVELGIPISKPGPPASKDVPALDFPHL